MPSGEKQAPQTLEDEGDGVAGSGGGHDVEEPALVLRGRTSSVVLDSKGSGLPSDHVDSFKEDMQQEHACYCRRRTQPERCGTTPLEIGANDAEAGSAATQTKPPAAQLRTNEPAEDSEGSELPWKGHSGTISPRGGAPRSSSARALKKMTETTPSAHVARSTEAPMAKQADYIRSEILQMASGLGPVLKEDRDRSAEIEKPELEKPSPPYMQATNRYSEFENLRKDPSEEGSDTSHGAMDDGNAPKPFVGPPLCEGDTVLTQDFLPDALIDGLFERLRTEARFQKMMHQGGAVPRFIAVQGTVEPDGTQPVYRHPSDESPPLAPFTPAVQMVRRHVERELGHPVNHVLIQCYRSGSDHISEHSDKTLDIFRRSYIANLSLGAMRTMVFRTKRGDKKDGHVAATAHAAAPSTPLEALDAAATKPADDLQDARPAKRRQTTRCEMPHNSLIKMGLVTNDKWLHGIKADKRPPCEKSPAELAWNGTRISLTFRYIATFLSPASDPGSPPGPYIWGQGAISKTRTHARPVLNGPTPQAVAMLRAFGRENNSPDFDWEANYGHGFDVLHMKAAPRYIGCGDRVVDGRVRIMLAECGVDYDRGDIGAGAWQQKSHRDVRGAEAGEVLPVRFELDDAERTTVVGDVAILLFLDAKYPRKRGSDTELSAVYSRFYAAIALEQRWKSLWPSTPNSRRALTGLKPHLTDLEAWAAKTAAGDTSPEPSIADYALWPVLHDVALAWRSVARGRSVGYTVFGYLGLSALDGYYREFGGRGSVVGVFGEDVVASALPGPRLTEDDESVEKESAEGED